MKRRKVALVSFLVLGGLSPLLANDISNNFRLHINQDTLDNLAKDLGALMGGGSFHEGSMLGFPFGFDLGVHVPVIRIEDNNPILVDDGTSVQALWGQAEIGLPAQINLIGRVGKAFDADLYGGGLRVGLINPLTPGVPSLSLTGLYGRMKHEFFNLDTVSANVVLSIDLPFIHPYIGGGYDRSNLKLHGSAYEGVPAGVSRDLEGEANGYRAEGGINLSIMPFTYINLGMGLANDKKTYHAGAGVRF